MGPEGLADIFGEEPGTAVRAVPMKGAVVVDDPANGAVVEQVAAPDGNPTLPPPPTELATLVAATRGDIVSSGDVENPIKPRHCIVPPGWSRAPDYMTGEPSTVDPRDLVGAWPAALEHPTRPPTDSVDDATGFPDERGTVRHGVLAALEPKKDAPATADMASSNPSSTPAPEIIEAPTVLDCVPKLEAAMNRICGEESFNIALLPRGRGGWYNRLYLFPFPKWDATTRKLIIQIYPVWVHFNKGENGRKKYEGLNLVETAIKELRLLPYPPSIDKQADGIDANDLIEILKAMTSYLTNIAGLKPRGKRKNGQREDCTRVIQLLKSCEFTISQEEGPVIAGRTEVLHDPETLFGVKAILEQFLIGNSGGLNPQTSPSSTRRLGKLMGNPDVAKE